jgi:hypothetical protein
MKTKTTQTMMAIVAITAGLLVSACGSSKQAAQPAPVTDPNKQLQQAGIAPEVEITFPCSGIDSDEEFLRVNGTGNSKDRAMAKDRAYINALAELSSKLAGVASRERKRNAVSTNADGEEFHDKVVSNAKDIAQANVAGYRTSCEKYTVNTQNGSYNCYVTIEFGKQKVVKQMYERLSADKLLRADYDFDRYMEEFDKDLKEYEKTHK